MKGEIGTKIGYGRILCTLTKGLVGSGTAAQTDVDSYKTGRDARWLLTRIHKSGWADEQRKAYQAAAALSGAERDAAVDALVSLGQLPSEQDEAAGEV